MKESLKQFDYLGVELHFLYNNKEQYHSITGGIIFLSFFLLSIIYIACNITPFVSRKNMTLIFYDKEIAHTDEIDFENFTSRFAYEFQCDGYDNITYVESLLSISINHVTVNTTSGNRIKTRKTLISPHCTMSNYIVLTFFIAIQFI